MRTRAIARAEGGATWLDFDSATQAFGLVTPGGIVGSTGVAGLTLGGGIGHLTSQHGLTCDNLVGAELVTPDGSVVRASADENAELSGGFAVEAATSESLRGWSFASIQSLVSSAAASSTRRRRPRCASALPRPRCARSPRELSCQAVIGVDESLTPAPRRRALLHGPRGRPRGAARAALGARARQRRRAAADVPRAAARVRLGVRRGRHYWKGHFVRELPDELIDELVERVVASAARPCNVLLESLHGAPKDTEAAHLGASRIATRRSTSARWRSGSTPTLDELHVAWARETAAAIEPWSLGGGYANYMQADEPIERIRASYGDEAFGRLRALKRRYDPANVLRRNQNIPP